MSWFTRLCRKTGLVINRTVHGPPATEAKVVQRRQVTQQKQLSPKVTLRRTTIEEVEIDEEGTAAGRKPEARNPKSETDPNFRNPND